MPLPLEGLRVVDFSRVLAGPHCGEHLLDLGADVIKVEPPSGDLSRMAFPLFGAVSGYYAQQNSGKRNISIDLNLPESREVVMRLTCAGYGPQVGSFWCSALTRLIFRPHLVSCLGPATGWLGQGARSARGSDAAGALEAATQEQIIDGLPRWAGAEQGIGQRELG